MHYLPPADDTPTGPIPVVTTAAMRTIKPLPPHLAVELAALRPTLDLISARFTALVAEIDRAQAQLNLLQAQLNLAVGA